jgi:hypothetical protein
MSDERPVPTTLEMDGLISEKDIENHMAGKLMFQCRACTKWTPQTYDRSAIMQSYNPCQHCQVTNFDQTSGVSLRSYDPKIKRKPK